MQAIPIPIVKNSVLSLIPSKPFFSSSIKEKMIPRPPTNSLQLEPSFSHNTHS
uniref:Candidate secreted effector n=1 Tax=Meloidogyne incognita TaxID=6306 RepID=A0A914NER8_MELIC